MKKIDTEGRLIALSGGSKRFVIHEVFMIIFAKTDDGKSGSNSNHCD
jgi:hypothetical protein